MISLIVMLGHSVYSGPERSPQGRPLPHGETLPPLFPLATTGCSGAALVSSALLDLVAEINNLLTGLNIMPLSLYGSFFI